MNDDITAALVRLHDQLDRLADLHMQLDRLAAAVNGLTARIEALTAVTVPPPAP